MPYTVNTAPDRIKKLPTKAQKIWIAAFNAAYSEYNRNEEKANKTAWTAVKKAGYKKNSSGDWVRWK